MKWYVLDMHVPGTRLRHLALPKVLNMHFINVDGNNGISATAWILHILIGDYTIGCDVQCLCVV